MRRFFLAAFTAVALGGGAASAQTVGDPKQITDSNSRGPLHFAEDNDSHGAQQYSTVKVVVYANGDYQVHYVFSNGNRLNHQHYEVEVKFVDERGRVIRRETESHDLDATLGGKTRKFVADDFGHFSPDEYARLHRYIVRQVD